MVKECLNRFRDISRLATNSDKSCLFTWGVAVSIKNKMLGTLRYQEGKLLVRYFRISLTFSRLKKDNCVVSVDKIATKAKSWAYKALSYVGMIQLINSILLACKCSGPPMSFLWKRGELSNLWAKVARNFIFLPKKECSWC
jgi:hypothetical protein